ncbi:allantoinase AllB [Streptomyces sp. ST2-7A]|uniref:allantoinase AllB n=1 Tax=Streptomyces sp. ST2-7A TaxID=2907214 RepID=UPI001F2CC97B|nr:allantoinase AllB [Streptomyces sp. ST2-7A]MCE7082071.1 allantoinase AllB [Streptomyces sp. ST2-7A]
MNRSSAVPPTVETLLRSTRVVLPEGTRPAAVALSGGRVDAVLPHNATPPAGWRLVDLDDTALLPGLVDTHVHVNDPGRTPWEGFATATRAAAAGGVTTIVDMPLNSLPPTTTVDALAVKRDVAGPRAVVDIAFWGGAVPDNAADLRPLHDAGVMGFKCFLSPSGVEEFPPLDPHRLDTVMAALAEFDALLLVHAEDPARLDAAPAPHGPRYADFLASPPPAAERDANARVLDLARARECRVHLLHLSAADPLPLIAAARRDGVRVTAETCPHFLVLTAEDVPDGATEFKCCPPIRDADNRDALWEALADGTIDCVVSDHSPCTADLKTPDFGTAWGGIASLQLGLPAVWTEAARRGHDLADVVRWMSAAPAALIGLDDRKGAIAPGRDADLVALDPDATLTVDPAALHHRNPVTAWAGRTLRGVVRRTWLRGTDITPGPPLPTAPTGEPPSRPTGRLLERTRP